MIMREISVFPMGDGPAVRFAVRALEKQGVHIASALTQKVSHVLLNIPTKNRAEAGWVA